MTKTWISLLAAGLLLAGCSSSSDAGGGAESPTTAPTTAAADSTTPSPSGGTAPALSPDDPCGAVTAADVVAAYGGQAADGTTDPTLPGRCTWKVTGSTYGDGRVSLYFASVQSRSAFDSAQAGLPGVKDVSGVGDAAFYQPMTGALEVAVGDTVFTTQGTFGAGSDVQDADTKLALAALGS